MLLGVWRVRSEPASPSLPFTQSTGEAAAQHQPLDTDLKQKYQPRFTRRFPQEGKNTQALYTTTSGVVHFPALRPGQISFKKNVRKQLAKTEFSSRKSE